MNKRMAVTTTAVSLGVATLLTMNAIAPAMAKSHGTSGSSFSTSSTKKAANDGTASGTTTPVAPMFATVNFTVTGVPTAYADAATAAKHLVFKIVPLAADATSAPATPPVPPFGKGPTGAKGQGEDADNDGDGRGGMGGMMGGWSPTASGTTSTTTPAPTPSAAPIGAPSFGMGDNDGDGPGAGMGHGHEGKGRGHMGKGRGMGFGHGVTVSNLVLSNGTLTGTISVPAGRAAGVTKFAVYPTVVADSANNIAAKTGTPVLLTVTTAADGSATAVASTPIAVSFN